MGWRSLEGTQWRYCVKVGLAAALGYLLARGGENQYAVYSAFTAALIVGATVGEDLATSVNRAKGTVVGMLAGMAVSLVFGPSALALGLAVAATALLALVLGWGIPVARIGVTVCIITLVAYGANALEYDLLRAFNTLIGIMVGLAVSFFVWPARGRDALERSLQQVLDAAARLLDALAAGEHDLRPVQLRLHDAVGAVVKAAREVKLERRLRLEARPLDVRGLQVLRLGFEILALSFGPEDPAREALKRRLDALATRA